MIYSYTLCGMYGPAVGAKPGDNEIDNFGRGLPALHCHAFLTHMQFQRKIKKIGYFPHICPIPRPKGTGVLKFTM